MPAKPPSQNRPTSEADKLERTLNRLLAAERRKIKNEDTIYLDKNGDIGYESIRTTAVPNSYTDPPSSPENGQQSPPPQPDPLRSAEPTPATELPAASSDTLDPQLSPAVSDPAPSPDISRHDDATAGQQTASAPVPPFPLPLSPCLPSHVLSPEDSPSDDPLEELLHRALARPRRGRPAAFDDHNKGKLVALLALGMSLRQAAAVLGVSHGTIHNTLKADPALAEEITAARFQAQLQPLACVIREARRSWKAATWLLKYLDAKIASHEETPDERRARQQRETDEFFARTGPNRRKR